MKVSNETKVGALTAIAITVLILGFNFLKGKNITERSNDIYAVFPDVEGLTPASPVYANGYQVGRVVDLTAKDENLTGIVVSITLTKSIRIPVNSYATINKTVLGSASIKVVLGNSDKFISDGDTLLVKTTPGMFDEVKNSLNPAVDNLTKTLASLDGVIKKLDAVVDPTAQKNLQSIIANLQQASKNLTTLLDTENGKLAGTLNNVESITGNLARNNGKIDSSLANVQRATAKIADLNLAETLESLKKTMSQLETTLAKVNSPNGTVGSLLNDRKLYDEIRQTNRSLTTLLDDFKSHPKRYVNVSVFGKKDKSTPLSKPIYDSVPDNRK